MTHAKNWQQDILIDGEECDFEHGHDQQLDRTGFTQDGSKGDEHRTGAKVGIDHTERRGFYKQAVSVLVSWPLKGAVSVTQHVPLHADVDFPAMHSMEEALHECGPLQREGGDQEVEAHAAEAVALQEGHEEAEANEDHHMHVLETWTKKKSKKPWAKHPKIQDQGKNETHIDRITQNEKIKSWTW